MGLLANMKPTSKLYEHKRYLETKDMTGKFKMHTLTAATKMLFQYFAKFLFDLHKD